MKDLKNAFKPNKPKITISIVLTLVQLWMPMGGVPPLFMLLTPLLVPPVVTGTNPTNQLLQPALASITSIAMPLLFLVGNFIAWYCLSSIAVYLYRIVKEK